MKEALRHEVAGVKTVCPDGVAREPSVNDLRGVIDGTHKIGGRDVAGAVFGDKFVQPFRNDLPQHAGVLEILGSV
jgi:hypothetical protein